MDSTYAARLIGAVFGVVFVVVNAGAAAGPWPWVIRALGVAGFAGVLLRIGRAGEARIEPRREAIAVYWASVVIEIAAIVVGSRLLSTHGHGEYGVALVAFVVGVHFLPFSWAFRQRGFASRGLTLMALAAIGAALGLLGAGDVAIAMVAGVASGLALMIYAISTPQEA